VHAQGGFTLGLEGGELDADFCHLGPPITDVSRRHFLSRTSKWMPAELHKAEDTLSGQGVLG
jgi:hypothetical protein